VRPWSNGPDQSTNPPRLALKSCKPSETASGLCRVVISTNPIAGTTSSAARVDRLVEHLEDRRLIPEVFTDLCAAVERAREWFNRGELRALVGVGGDGTASELVRRTPPGLPVALLPAGNQNLLAHHLGIGPDPAQLCQAIVEGRQRRIDAAAAGGKGFLLMIGCGFDAEVVWRVHRGRRGHAGNWAYVKPILQTLRSYDWPTMRLSWQGPDGRSGSLSGATAFVFNLPRYGGGLGLAPWAIDNDGLLDLCVFARGGIGQAGRYLAHVLLGRHQRVQDVTTLRATRVRIEADRPVRYQLDGDPGGWLPVDVEVLPGRATMIVPPGQGPA